MAADGVIQISFNESGSHVVVVSKLDARVFFLLNKSPEFDDLELLGLVIMNNPVLAHAWDHQASTGDLLSLLSQVSSCCINVP